MKFSQLSLNDRKLLDDMKSPIKTVKDRAWHTFQKMVSSTQEIDSAFFEKVVNHFLHNEKGATNHLRVFNVLWAAYSVNPEKVRPFEKLIEAHSSKSFSVRSASAQDFSEKMIVVRNLADRMLSGLNAQPEQTDPQKICPRHGKEISAHP